MQLHGIIPACITPFYNDIASPKAMQINASLWLEAGVHGLLVFGSTGEFPYLEAGERRSVLQAARAVTPTHRFLLAGCGAEGTAETLRNLHWAAEDGADAALVVTPVYYTRGNTEAQRQHFLSLADSTPLPILLYTVPAFTAYDLPVDLILELAEHPMIIGIKDSSSDLKRLGMQIQHGPEGFAIFAGSPIIAFPALSLGTAGSITAFANIVPEIFVALWDAIRSQDLQRAADLQKAIIQLHADISQFGIPALKAILNRRGYQPGQPRAPLLSLPPDKASQAITAWERAMDVLAI